MGADGTSVAVTRQPFKRVSVGEIAFDDPSLYVGNLPVFGQLGLSKGPALILGLDLLSKRDVVLDYTRSQLFIGPMK